MSLCSDRYANAPDQGLQAGDNEQYSEAEVLAEGRSQGLDIVTVAEDENQVCLRRSHKPSDC